MMYAIGMPLYGMTLLPSFMKMDTGVEVIIRFCLSNLNGCNVGFFNGEKILSASLRLN
jgi:uncharacterized protein YraI